MISFREKKKKKPIRTYIQVDGEYLQINRPKYMQISLCADLPDGKINTLFRNRVEKSKNVMKETMMASTLAENNHTPDVEKPEHL